MNTYYNEILTDHNLHPGHKHGLAAATCALHGVNPSCGDSLTLQLSLDEDGTIRDGSFEGEGCAISQASADIMLDLVLGHTREEALRLTDLFMRMIRGEATEEEIEEQRKLEERRQKLHEAYLKRKANGKQREYEERVKAKKKAEMEAKNEAIRQEDIKKGVFIPVSMIQAEPKKGVVCV